jgi:hypothetical protein
MRSHARSRRRQLGCYRVVRGLEDTTTRHEEGDTLLFLNHSEESCGRAGAVADSMIACRMYVLSTYHDAVEQGYVQIELWGISILSTKDEF